MSKPAIAVRVDEPIDFSMMIAKALEEAKKNINGTLSGLMFIVSRNDEELTTEEISSLDECFSRLDVDFKFGIQQNEQIENGRCITIYAFEK